jgi:HD-GYP domain-containing protein (c-di-GMP phosphodiesterase class II)
MTSSVAPAESDHHTNATSLAGDEAMLRHRGREFLLAMYKALRSLKFYPVENEQVQSSLNELTSYTIALFECEDELEVRIAGELLFVNATRLRLDLDNYASFSYVLNTFRSSGVGIMHVDPDVERREWQVFLSLLLSHTANEHGNDDVSELQEKLAQAGVTHIIVDEPNEGERDLADEEKQREVAKRTYERTIAVTKDVVNSARMGRSANVRKIKRAVQNIIDQVLNNEISLVGLTTLRDYDDYTFTHSVNVCIFSVSIGKRLGLPRSQLFDLGMAALVHDVGKGRVPVEVLTKQGKFTPEEWRQMQGHTWLGALNLFKLRGLSDVPYRSMITAYEHHMKVDLTGYPESIRPRQLSVFSKIIAVADVFDAATSSRVYKAAKSPDQILREIWENPGFGYDPVLVKALINLVGVYPVGTCILLDTYELAVVHSANPDLSQIHRPVARVVLSANGHKNENPPLVNLADTHPDGSFARSIIKVTDPTQYGITPSDYFV